MRVFISHSSKDKPAVERLARALLEQGFEPWYDAWEIAAGDSIVDQINTGLEAAQAGLIVFSAASKASRWVEAEAGYLTYARIQEGKALIPVVIGDDAYIPPLLRPLARVGIEEVEAIVAALRSRRGAPPVTRKPEDGVVEKVLVSLRKEGASGVAVSVTISGTAHTARTLSSLPRPLLASRLEFLKGFKTGLRRSPEVAMRAAQEKNLAELGEELAALCLPGDSGLALSNLVTGSPIGTTVEVIFEADSPELLGLPFEALCLPGGEVLSTQAKVVVLRRPVGLTGRPLPPLAGPIKILVAVGAPDEGETGSAVLDHERECQNILDAVDFARRRETVEVRFLEVGHPDTIAEAMERDAYHVLHLSCHGMPGKLELETEDGGKAVVSAEELLGSLRDLGRPLPLVFLNSCHGGVEAEQAASLAGDLLAAGVPAVVAMQASVSDGYATELAGAFYEALAAREPVVASRALATARKEVEKDRLEALRRGVALPWQQQPEFATPALLVAGEERPLADFSLANQPLSARPVHDLSGPVPQLRLDELVGRRKELRETLRALRDPARAVAGVVLTGIGGVGKSALAGRTMRRMVEGGFLVVAVVGRLDVRKIGLRLAAALLDRGGDEALEQARLLNHPQLDDPLRLMLIAKALAEQPLVLVLDDFEQNLVKGGASFLDSATAETLDLLVGSARRGKLLVTCRHPLPGFEARLRHLSVGPLSLAESRKLLLRLPALSGRPSSELAQVLRVVGGHPRMLEFLDALLRGGTGRLEKVTEKLQKLAAEEGLALGGQLLDLDEAIQQAITLGARDVVLLELLSIARTQGTAEVLLQAAVSNLPTAPAGLAHMLSGGATDAAEVGAALDRLEALSLVVRFSDGSAWVHRWTAEGLARLEGKPATQDRSNRAGRYRWWRVQNETHDLGDAVEAVRNHLAGRDFENATNVAFACFGALTRFRQSGQLAALASEILETLPEDHSEFGPVADAEAQALLALGFTEKATTRYEALLSSYLKLAAAEPDRADYQRDLSVSFNKVGDLYSALGQGDKARDAYLAALDIRERLAAAEPDRADYQRDLSVSFNKVGDLYSALGQGDKARDAYLAALDIAQRLAAAEPDRADYQRDLSVSHDKLSNFYQERNEPAEALAYRRQDLAIARHLVQLEPARADFQVDLATSLMGEGALQGASGRASLEEAREILERLEGEGRLQAQDTPRLERVVKMLNDLV